MMAVLNNEFHRLLICCCFIIIIIIIIIIIYFNCVVTASAQSLKQYASTSTRQHFYHTLLKGLSPYAERNFKKLSRQDKKSLTSYIDTKSYS